MNTDPNLNNRPLSINVVIQSIDIIDCYQTIEAI